MLAYPSGLSLAWPRSHLGMSSMGLCQVAGGKSQALSPWSEPGFRSALFPIVGVSLERSRDCLLDEAM